MQFSLTLWCGVCVSDIRTFAASPHQGPSCVGHEANFRFLDHLLDDSVLKVSQRAASSGRPRIKRKIAPRRDCSRNLAAPSAAMCPRPTEVIAWRWSWSWTSGREDARDAGHRGKCNAAATVDDAAVVVSSLSQGHCQIRMRVLRYANLNAFRRVILAGGLE